MHLRPAALRTPRRIVRLAVKRVGAGLLLAFCLAAASRAQTLAERLLAQYDAVRSLSCEIRKDVSGAAGTVRTLSRVYYERPDRLNVENFTPVKRRIVCDGTNFFSYVEGDSKGFTRPVAELDEIMLLQLRKIPGTAADHLFRLRGTGGWCRNRHGGNERRRCS
jgi:outer membrane lipoprotein-sorting protein